MNLPTEVKFDNSSTKKINYTYDASGAKLKKVVNDGGILTTTDYAGDYVYEGDSLKFFNHAEGYVEPDGSSFDYVYQYKDHLGNIRLSYKDVSTTSTPSLEIQEENNYYPFGLKHKGYNNVVVSEHKWDYLGQERQEELGLNWLTFRYRNYDPEIGRFFGIDPVSADYVSISTYQFAHNNPIWKIEIEGLEGRTYNGKKDPITEEPVGSPISRAVSNPAVQKYASKSASSAKGILKGNLKVKPKLGMGISGKANIGPLNGELDLNVITVSGGAEYSNNELTTNLDAKVLTGSAKLGAGDKSIKTSATLVKAGLEGTVDSDLNAQITDSSAEGPTANLATSNGSNSATLTSDNDFSIGGAVKVFKAIEASASVNLTELGSAVGNAFGSFAKFVEALYQETVNDSERAVTNGMK